MMELRDVVKVLGCYPILVVHGKKARLYERDAALASAPGRQVTRVLMLDAQRATRGFVRVAGRSERVLSTDDIASCAGGGYQQVRGWLRDGLLRASVRPSAGPGRGRGGQFLLTDGLLASILGLLRRSGNDLSVLRKVSAFWYEDLLRLTQRVETAV